MRIFTLITIPCWGILLLYWVAKSRKIKAAVQTQTRVSRYIYMFFLISGFVMVYARFMAIGILGYQLIPVNLVSGITGAVICISGIAFAIWARKTLGENWSGEVTLKKEHELVQSGPYKIVRHPIYTGFEIGLLGVAITIGQLKGLVGLAIVFSNHYYKTIMEEKIMYKTFPTQYPVYAKRVKRLVPFIF